MTELKTLKDTENYPIKFPRQDVQLFYEETRKLFCRELRVEAIKWAKSLKVHCKCGKRLVPFCEGDTICPDNASFLDLEQPPYKHDGGTETDLAVYEWIINFFNLTEEDFKNETN